MIPEIEKGSTSSHCVEKSLWKKLWMCRKRDNIDGPVNTAQKFVSQEPATEPHASPVLDAPAISTRVIAVCKEGT